MGELVAWIIGWDLILEYARRRGHGRDRVERVPQQVSWSTSACTCPTRGVTRRSHGDDAVDGSTATASSTCRPCSSSWLLTALLDARHPGIGVRQRLIVITKVADRPLVIALGWGFINPANHTPFIPRASPTRRPRASRTTTAASWASWARPASCSSPSSASTPCRPRRRKPRTRSATCRSASSARWSSARSSTCSSRTC